MSFISVIVTAYNRRKFIDYALNSLFRQSLNKEKFEIILISNFKLDYPGVTNIYSDKEDLGEKIYAGLQEAKGEIICFLDDDDAFKENKLERVLTLCKRDCVYYHNNLIPINEQGKEIEIKTDYLKIPPYATLRRIDYPLIIEDLRKINVKEALKLNVNFNSSSVCIKRKVLEKNSVYLSKIKVLIDSFMFYSSFTHKGKIILDPERLTYYRIHALQTSSGKPSDIEEFRKSFSRLLLKVLDDMRVIKDMLNGHLEDVIEEEITRYTLLYNIFSYPQRKCNQHKNDIKIKRELALYYLISRAPSFVKKLYIKKEFEKRYKLLNYQ